MTGQWIVVHINSGHQEIRNELKIIPERIPGKRKPFDGITTYVFII